MHWDADHRPYGRALNDDPRTLRQLLNAAGFTDERDAATTQDYCHTIRNSDGDAVGRLSAAGVVRFLVARHENAPTGEG
jgi:hypothetical protein